MRFKSQLSDLKNKYTLFIFTKEENKPKVHIGCFLLNDN